MAITDLLVKDITIPSLVNLPRLVICELVYRILFMYNNPQDYQKTIKAIQDSADRTTHNVIIHFVSDVQPNMTIRSQYGISIKSGGGIFVKDDKLTPLISKRLSVSAFSYGIFLSEDDIEDVMTLMVKYARTYGVLDNRPDIISPGYWISPVCEFCVKAVNSVFTVSERDAIDENALITITLRKHDMPYVVFRRVVWESHKIHINAYTPLEILDGEITTLSYGDIKHIR